MAAAANHGAYSTNEPKDPFVYDAQSVLYGLPLNCKKLNEWGPWGKAPAVDCPASEVGYESSRADMALHHR